MNVSATIKIHGYKMIHDKQTISITNSQSCKKNTQYTNKKNSQSSHHYLPDSVEQAVRNVFHVRVYELVSNQVKVVHTTTKPLNVLQCVNYTVTSENIDRYYLENVT